MDKVKPKVLTVTVSSAGTAQRVGNIEHKPSEGKIRFVKSAYFEADKDNAGKCFVGDADVDATAYAASLDAEDGITFATDWHEAPGAVKPQKLDLYNTWVDAASSNDQVHVTVFIDFND